MVSVVHALPLSDVHVAIPAGTLDLLVAGVPPEGRGRIESALALAGTLYGRNLLESGESALNHAIGTALIAASLNLDIDTRLAALLFAVADGMGEEKLWRDKLSAEFGETAARHRVVPGVQAAPGQAFGEPDNHRGYTRRCG